MSTVFAPASGFGRAAIAVIRISGPAAGAIVTSLAGGCPPPRMLSLRTLRDPASGEVLDRGLVAWMPGPATFTGEDMAELHLHGGLAVRTALLRALATFPDCVAAGPGEFTRRAVLNGRIGLTEAEATADLVDAETEAQRRQALRQLDGSLGHQVAAWRETAIGLLAVAEAAVDFSDEDDVDESLLSAALAGDGHALRCEIGAALRDGRRGERLRDGFVVVLAGPPNAGKSTLLNALAGRDAAIVSDVPGTTRDAIEIRCDLGGLPVILIDTAGLREAGDAIEAEGIARTRRHIARADLVLDLRAAASGDRPLQTMATCRRLDVVTKIDLLGSAHPEPFADPSCSIHRPRPEVPRSGLEGGLSGSLRPLGGSFEAARAAPRDEEAGGTSSVRPGSGDGLAVSAVTGLGLDRLLAAIEAEAQAGLGGGALLTRERHREALSRAHDHLARAVEAGSAAHVELVAEDLRLAARALGEVGGHVGVEDVLDRLFAGFCIGK